MTKWRGCEVPEAYLEACELPDVMAAETVGDLEDALAVAYVCARDANADKAELRALCRGDAQ